MTRTIWRGRCEHVDIRVPDGDRPTPPISHCRDCGGRELTWTRWEVVEAVHFVAFVTDEKGEEYASHRVETLAEARAVLDPKASHGFALPGEKTRIVEKTTRALRRVK